MEPMTMLAVGQAALGVGQAISGYNAQKQDYLNQTAFQDANNEFASWQAGFNAKINDANKQYNYLALGYIKENKICQ